MTNHCKHCLGWSILICWCWRLKALMNRFGLFGPPSLVFFSVDGRELSDVRVQGEVGAAGCGYDHDIGRVSVVGAGMKSNPGVAAKMFQVLAENEINIEMISTSAIRISCVVQESQVERAVELLHTAFDLDV